MKLSIIVPVFNVEKYIKKCIESLIKINREDMEILIIDDGSTDNSIEKISNINDKRIKIIKQENRGLSGARNTGLKNSVGKYILFVDSDDYISDNDCINKMIIKAEENKSDIIIANGLCFDENLRFEPIYKKDDLIKKEYINGKDFLKDALKNKFYKDMVWLNLYRRDLIIENNIYFLDKVYHEDFEWMIRIFEKAGKINFINQNFYMYRVSRNGSITNKKNIKNFLDLMKISEKLYYYFKNLDDKDLKELIDERLLDIFYMAAMSGKDYDTNFFCNVNKKFFKNRSRNIKINIKYKIAQINLNAAYKITVFRRRLKF
ncbi:glycosyltransferase [Clostridium baratii]